MSTEIRFLCPTCNAVMSAPMERAGNKINCLKCGQRMQVPPAERAKTLLSPALGLDDRYTADPSPPNTGVTANAPPPLPTAAGEHGRWYQDRLVPVLAASCYGGVWVSFAANCMAFLMPSPGLMIVFLIVSLLLTGATLSAGLYTFMASAKLWGSAKSGAAVAGLVSSTLTTLYCTLVLMCNCGTGTLMVKGIDLMSGVARRF